MERKIGKFLAYILRHKPEAIGLNMNDRGWVDVKELIEKMRPQFYIDFNELKNIVINSSDKRYEFSDDFCEIRARHGHSISIDLNLPVIVPPDLLFHGTAQRFVDLIKKQGLNRMSRDFVHLYGEEKVDVAKNVGQRHEKEKDSIIIIIESGKMVKDGFEFYKTKNDVFLTKEVPAKYLKF